MKKVFVMAYLRKNFGDDLFVKMLLEKYKNIDFYIKCDKNEFIDILDKYGNLHILYGKDTDEELYNLEVNEYDAYVDFRNDGRCPGRWFRRFSVWQGPGYDRYLEDVYQGRCCRLEGPHSLL